LESRVWKTDNRALTIAAIIIFVFPVGWQVTFILVTVPIGVVLDLTTEPAQWLTTLVLWAACIAGVGGGVWLCRYAWPSRSEANHSETVQANKPNTADAKSRATD